MFRSALVTILCVLSCVAHGKDRKDMTYQEYQTNQEFKNMLFFTVILGAGAGIVEMARDKANNVEGGPH